MIAGVLIVSTVVTHAVGTTLLVRQLRRHLERPDAGFKDRRAMPAQIWAVFVLTLLHVIEIPLWALAYPSHLPDKMMCYRTLNKKQLLFPIIA